MQYFLIAQRGSIRNHQPHRERPHQPHGQADQLDMQGVGRFVDRVFPLRRVAGRPERLRHSGVDPIQRATHRIPTALQDMGIDHGGLYVVMAQQLLHSADVVTAFQQVRGK